MPLANPQTGHVTNVPRDTKKSSLRDYDTSNAGIAGKELSLRTLQRRAEIENADRANIAMAEQRRNEQKILRDERNENTTAKGHMERDIELSGQQPFKIVKNAAGVATKEYADWQSPFDEKDAELRGKLKENEAAAAAVPPRLLPAVDKWIGRNRQFDEADLPQVTLKKNQTWQEAVEDAVAARCGAAEELRAIERAPRPKADAAVKVRAEFARRAKIGNPVFGSILAGGKQNGMGEWEIKTPNARLHFPQIATGLLRPGTVDMVLLDDSLSFMIWALHDELLEKVLARLDAIADDSNAISEADKPARLKEAHAELTAAWRVECETVRAAQQAGFAIAHDPKTPVKVLLGLE